MEIFKKLRISSQNVVRKKPSNQKKSNHLSDLLINKNNFELELKKCLKNR